MEKRRSYVYKIVCKITGEYYFGSSFYAKRDCYWGKGRRIKELISLYGKEHFVKEILEEFDDRVEAHKKENQYIEKFRNDDKCLNIKCDKHFGAFSDESCAKNSAANLGKILSKEHRTKISAALHGKTFSKEHREKISATKRGEKHPMYGKHHTDEAKAKISAAERGEKHHNFGKHLSEETKQKIRESLRDKTPWNKGKKLNKETGKYE